MGNREKLGFTLLLEMVNEYLRFLNAKVRSGLPRARRWRQNKWDLRTKTTCSSIQIPLCSFRITCSLSKRREYATPSPLPPEQSPFSTATVLCLASTLVSAELYQRHHPHHHSSPRRSTTTTTSFSNNEGAFHVAATTKNWRPNRQPVLFALPRVTTVLR